MDFSRGSPGWFKFALMEKGVHIADDARTFLEEKLGNRPFTNADYASTSGISLILPGEVYVNAPTEEFNPNFVEAAPFVLRRVGDGLLLTGGGPELPVNFIPVSDYHDQKNEWGEAYTSYAFTHTDRVRISPVEGCAYTCKFCDLPYEFRYRTKRIDGLVDSVRHALRDPMQPASHVLISGGVPRGDDYAYLQESYRQVLTAFPDVPIDIMMVPAPGLLKLDELGSLGVNQLSINLELYGDDAAKRIMPRKAKQGRDSYLRFIELAVEKLGPGSVRSLLLAGIEPMEDTVKGVAALAERGCEPVLSPFRPDPKTPMSKAKPPTADEMREIYLRSAEVAARHGMRLGPRCIPCMHNTMTFPDGSDHYYSHGHVKFI